MTEILLAIGGLVAMVASGVMSFFRSRRQKRVLDKAQEAVELKNELDVSREKLLRDREGSAEKLVELKGKLLEKRRELNELRADKYRGRSDIDALLKELER